MSIKVFVRYRFEHGSSLRTELIGTGEPVDLAIANKPVGCVSWEILAVEPMGGE